MIVQSTLASFSHKLGQREYMIFQFMAGLCYVTILHGYRVIFTLLITLGNFALTRVFSGAFLRKSVWIYNLAVLVLVSWDGESWTLPFVSSFRGMSGWAHMFNMFMLKQISFGVDFSSSSSGNIVSYLGYIFYTPLFLAGPIVTYEGWLAQVETCSINWRYTRTYALRWIVSFVIIEVWTHLSYANTIAAHGKSSVLALVTSPVLAFHLSVSVFVFMWLKFLLIWRFFRLWSLLNGIDVPENMNRCVMTNYSMVQFWKDWHASFNLWLIKYVYIPLGGSRSNRFLNIFIVFTFVALWHDMNWRVFHWAFLVFAIMAPELVCTAIYRSKLGTFRSRHPTLAKILKTSFAALNINFLILANMVGYVFGIDGVDVLRRNPEWDIYSVFAILAFLYSSASMTIWLDHRRALAK